MLPLNPSKIPELYQTARSHQKKREFTKALDLYKIILNARPNLAEVHFQIAQIHLSSGDYRKASEAAMRAISLKPGEDALWKTLVSAVTKAADPELTAKALEVVTSLSLSTKAKAELRQRLSGQRTATKISTGNADPAEIQAIVNALNSRDINKALRSARAVLKRNPDLPLAHNLLAGALQAKGDMAKAAQSYRNAIKLDGNYGEAYTNYGRMLAEQGDQAEAIRQLEIARSFLPKSKPNLAALGRAYAAQSQRRQAIEVYNDAIRHHPKDAGFYLARAWLHYQNNDPKSALTDIKKCEALGLRNSDVLVKRAKIENASGDGETALRTLERARKLGPSDSAILEAKASILQSQGDFDGAKDAFLSAIEQSPTAGTLYRQYAASHKFTADDPLISTMKDVISRDNLPDIDRLSLGFALSKALEDCGNYAESFEHLSRSNTMIRERYPYDIKSRRKEIDRVKDLFVNFTPLGHPATGSSDYAPIFVTGMPRSGTTLVEQIISSHSTVTGGGEVGRLSRQSYALMMKPGDQLPADKLTPADVDAVAADYEQFMRELLPGSDRVTDKSIQTYLMMGFVWLALPKARIVVVRRDPRDNLLSIYKNVFPEGSHLYSNDLSDLGQYYRMFVEMIDFWRGIAPDRFYEIQYEDLIADPEVQSRALIDACGLDWEDACLNFHQNKRRVDTLSLYQVRQPIYKSSVKGWKRYEKELQPLFAALGDLLPES